MNVSILVISTLSLITSAATLATVIIGGKQAKEEVQEIQDKVNNGLTKFRDAINEIEL